jgi:ribosome recycling factor
MLEQIIQETKQKLNHSLEAFERELGTVRAGRANPSLVENLLVEAYGSTMKLQELASITAPEAAMLIVQPWDSSVIGPISNAIRTSDLNLNPVVDSTIIRLPIPPLTQERRQEMVKLVGRKAEEGKVAVRSIRHDAFSELKRHKDNGEISQDEQLGLEKRLQEVVDATNKQIETAAQQKEQELLKM